MRALARASKNPSLSPHFNHHLNARAIAELVTQFRDIRKAALLIAYSIGGHTTLLAAAHSIVAA